jgi:hypothetical protein
MKLNVKEYEINETRSAREEECMIVGK